MDPRDVRKELIPEIEEEILFIVAGYRMEEILARFEKALEGEGGESLRLEVCKALMSQKQEKFSTTLNQLMEETQEMLDDKRERMLEPDPSIYVFWPKSFVSVEGLALLKIAVINRLSFIKLIIGR